MQKALFKQQFDHLLVPQAVTQVAVLLPGQLAALQLDSILVLIVLCTLINSLILFIINKI